MRPAQPAAPRITPGTNAEIGRLNSALLTVVGRVTGAGRPNLFTTLARHRRLFRAWLRFAARLMPYGTLPAVDTELVILRVAAHRDCAYEAAHHRPRARRAGLTDAQIDALATDPDTADWTPRQLALIMAADELNAQGRIGEYTWRRLTQWLTEEQLIELCLLVGHYHMLAMTIASVGIELDASTHDEV